MMRVWRLSVAYIGLKSRTEGLGRLKLAQRLATSLMTRTPLSTLKGQRSRSPGRFTHRGVYGSVSCSGDGGNVFSVGTYCYVAVRRGRLGGARRFGAHGSRAERGGAYYDSSYTACYI